AEPVRDVFHLGAHAVRPRDVALLIPDPDEVVPRAGPEHGIADSIGQDDRALEIVDRFFETIRRREGGVGRISDVDKRGVVAALTRGLDSLERELATWLPLEGGVVRVCM